MCVVCVCVRARVGGIMTACSSLSSEASADDQAGVAARTASSICQGEGGRCTFREASDNMAGRRVGRSTPAAHDGDAVEARPWARALRSLTWCQQSQYPRVRRRLVRPYCARGPPSQAAGSPIPVRHLPQCSRLRPSAALAGLCVILPGLCVILPARLAPLGPLARNPRRLPPRSRPRSRPRPQGGLALRWQPSLQSQAASGARVAPASAAAAVAAAAAVPVATRVAVRTRRTGDATVARRTAASLRPVCSPAAVWSAGFSQAAWRQSTAPARAGYQKLPAVQA